MLPLAIVTKLANQTRVTTLKKLHKAMPQINLDNVSDAGRPYIKSDVYTVRVLDAEQRMSKSNKPMIVLNVEFVSPETITDDDGNNIKIAGIRFNDYISLADNALYRLKTYHKLLDLPSNIDTDSMDTSLYRGRAFDASIKTEQSDQKSGDGTPLVNPDTGMPYTSNQYRITLVLRANKDFDIEAAF